MQLRRTRQSLARRLAPVVSLAAGVALIGGALAATASAQPRTNFTAEITSSANPAMELTGGAYLVHRQDGEFWMPGQRADTALERIAEIGNSRWAERTLLAEPFGPAPIPGTVTAFMFSASPGDKLSTAQSLAASNDAFTGVANLPLFEGATASCQTVDIFAWDAGTEYNWPLFSPFRSGQPDESRGAENISNGVDTPDEVIAMSDQFDGAQAQLRVCPAQASSSLPAGGMGGLAAGDDAPWALGLLVVGAALAASGLILAIGRSRLTA